jgi:hypothetical protein
MGTWELTDAKGEILVNRKQSRKDRKEQNVLQRNQWEKKPWQTC